MVKKLEYESTLNSIVVSVSDTANYTNSPPIVAIATLLDHEPTQDTPIWLSFSRFSSDLRRLYTFDSAIIYKVTSIMHYEKP